MNPKLKEAAIHGSKEYPVAVYDLQNIGPSFHVSLHWHKELEIIYVYEGPLYVTIDKQDYIGKKGDIFIVNPKEIHKMHVQDNYVRYGTLLFSPKSLLFHETDEITRKYLQPLCIGDVIFHRTIDHEELGQTLFSFITKIVQLNREKVPAYRLGTKALLLEIIFLLFHHNMAINSPHAAKDSSLNREIISYIGDRYTDNLTLTEIADKFHMSYKYFSRYFKNTFHTTLSDYIMKLRLERAELLLTSTGLPVTDISLQTGFNNISFFIRSFKQAYGLTPLQYRNHKGSVL